MGLIPRWLPFGFMPQGYRISHLIAFAIVCCALCSHSHFFMEFDAVRELICMLLLKCIFLVKEQFCSTVELFYKYLTSF